jgi:hypothetical protein
VDRAVAVDNLTYHDLTEVDQPEVVRLLSARGTSIRYMLLGSARPDEPSLDGARPAARHDRHVKERPPSERADIATAR